MRACAEAIKAGATAATAEYAAVLRAHGHPEKTIARMTPGMSIYFTAIMEGVATMLNHSSNVAEKGKVT